VRISDLAITLAMAASFLVAAPAAHGQLNRTAASVAGNDANNCSLVAPCRTIGHAVSQTNPGGEVVVLDSAGYGPFTIDRAITVQAAPGVYAGVTAPAGNAIQINAGVADRVVLRGLTINGLGTGSAGIAFTGGGAELHVENCVINGFVDWGIISFFALRVQDTIVRDSGTGIHVDNAGAPVNATLERVQLKSNSLRGVLAWRNATVTVRDSVATLNGTGFRGDEWRCTEHREQPRDGEFDRRERFADWNRSHLEHDGRRQRHRPRGRHRHDGDVEQQQGERQFERSFGLADDGIAEVGGADDQRRATRFRRAYLDRAERSMALRESRARSAQSDRGVAHGYRRRQLLAGDAVPHVCARNEPDQQRGRNHRPRLGRIRPLHH